MLIVNMETQTDEIFNNIISPGGPEGDFFLCILGSGGQK